MKSKRDAKWYKNVLDAMSDMVLVKGDRSKLLWANKAFLDYYGMTSEELEDLVDSPHSDPDDTVQYVKDDHYVYSTGQTLNVESEPVTNSHGTVGYFNTAKSAIEDPQGQVVRTVGVSRPIADEALVATSVRERATRKLQLSELRTMVRTMPLAVAMLDAKQRFMSYSLAWSELFGYAEDDLVGQFYEDVFEGAIALSATIGAAIATKQAATEETASLRRLSGGQRVVDVELRPWSLPSGDTGGVIVLLHDVTRMQAAQEDLRRLNEELSQFNYRVSHDLVAPLKTVLGFIDLCESDLEEGNLDDVRSYHGLIKQNVTQLSGLVEDVLNLARADVVSEERDTIDLEAVLRLVTDKYRGEIEAAGISVSLNIEVATLRCERVRLLQVMENLVANAVKYYDPSKERRVIDIRASMGANPNSELTVTIRDNGIGFDPAIDVFAIFTRGTSKYAGSGLGLYIVKKHLDRMQGAIRVLSSQDDTVFEVTLPAPAPENPR